MIVGSDYTDVGTPPSELSFNARIAANLSAPPMVLALKADGRSPEAIADLAEGLLAEVGTAHATPIALVANRCDPPTGSTRSGRRCAAPGVPSLCLPEEPILFAPPTMAELKEALGATMYSGDEEFLDHEALRVMVGGMTVEHILERLTDGTVVITPADRSDVLLALVNANTAQGFPRLSGIILNGGLKPHPMIERW